MQKVRADADARPASYGFVGDPTRPIVDPGGTTRFYGYLLYVGATRAGTRRAVCFLHVRTDCDTHTRRPREGSSTTWSSSGRFETKADAVRTALEALIDAERRADIGRQIVEGYQRVPQEDVDVAAASQAATRSIDEEPW